MHSIPISASEHSLQPLLTVKEVAELLRMSPSTVIKWCHERKIDFIYLNRKYLFEAHIVNEFVGKYRGARFTLKKL